MGPARVVSAVSPAEPERSLISYEDFEAAHASGTISMFADLFHAVAGTPGCRHAWPLRCLAHDEILVSAPVVIQAHLHCPPSTASTLAEVKVEAGIHPMRIYCAALPGTRGLRWSRVSLSFCRRCPCCLARKLTQVPRDTIIVHEFLRGHVHRSGPISRDLGSGQPGLGSNKPCHCRWPATGGSSISSDKRSYHASKVSKLARLT